MIIFTDCGEVPGAGWYRTSVLDAFIVRPNLLAAHAKHIRYKFKSSQALKARLQSSKHASAKQNFTQNGHSGSFKVTCFGVSGKVIRD